MMHVISTAPSTEVLSRREAAERLHVTVATLAKWAQRGRGPGYSLTGERLGRALYTQAAIDAWVAQQQVRRPEQADPGAGSHP